MDEESDIRIGGLDWQTSQEMPDDMRHLSDIPELVNGYIEKQVGAKFQKYRVRREGSAWMIKAGIALVRTYKAGSKKRQVVAEHTPLPPPTHSDEEITSKPDWSKVKGQDPEALTRWCNEMGDHLSATMTTTPMDEWDNRMTAAFDLSDVDAMTSIMNEQVPYRFSKDVAYYVKVWADNILQVDEDLPGWEGLRRIAEMCVGNDE